MPQEIFDFVLRLARRNPAAPNQLLLRLLLPLQGHGTASSAFFVFSSSFCASTSAGFRLNG